MFRYCLDVYIENDLIYNHEFKSITELCKTMDRFKYCKGLWFDVYDSIKGISISANELMRLWHA